MRFASAPPPLNPPRFATAPSAAAMAGLRAPVVAADHLDLVACLALTGISTPRVGADEGAAVDVSRLVETLGPL